MKGEWGGEGEMAMCYGLTDVSPMAMGKYKGRLHSPPASPRDTWLKMQLQSKRLYMHLSMFFLVCLCPLHLYTSLSVCVSELMLVS